MSELNWELERYTGPRVTPDDLRSATHQDGRDGLDIFPPRILGHYCQKLAGEVGDFASELALKFGVDEATAKRIGTHLATRGLGKIINIAEFGYAERVLEERLGLGELPVSNRLE